MADEKVVVGWAVRAAIGTVWLGPNTSATVPRDWQEKPRRRIFPTRDEAFKEFYGNGMARDREAAVVRITRKVKPKQYFVVAGPISQYSAAQAIRDTAAVYFPGRFQVVKRIPANEIPLHRRFCNCRGNRRGYRRCDCPRYLRLFLAPHNQPRGSPRIRPRCPLSAGGSLPHPGVSQVPTRSRERLLPRWL